MTEVSPGFGSSSSLKIPLCRNGEEFKENGHIEIYAAQEGNGQVTSDWSLYYQIWQNGETVRFSTGGEGFSAHAKSLDTAQVDEDNTLTVFDLEGYMQIEAV